MFTCKYDDADDKLHAVMMQPLKSGHVTMDLTEKPTEIPWDQAVKQSWNALLEMPSKEIHTDGSAFWSEGVDSYSDIRRNFTSRSMSTSLVF